MKPSDLKNYLGKRCTITFLNRQGNEAVRRMEVQDLTYVPLYGNYVIGDVEDICLDRITSINAIN